MKRRGEGDDLWTAHVHAIIIIWRTLNEAMAVHQLRGWWRLEEIWHVLVLVIAMSANNRGRRCGGS